MKKKLVEEALGTYMDIYDTKTRKAILAMDEAESDSVLLSLTAKLYQMIVNRVDDIDFGEIPETKGDITKLTSYPNIVESVNILHDILVQYKQDTEPVDTITKSIENIVSRDDLWKKGFIINVEIIQVTYCEIVLAIINSIAYMIASTVEYIKTPNNEGFAITIDKVGAARTKDSLVYGCLVKFNESCKKGHIESAFNPLIRARAKNFLGTAAGVVAGSIAIAGILMNILPILRELAYFFFSVRVNVSDYFEAQAKLLEMSATDIELGKVQTAGDKKKVIERQKGIASFFRKISNKICVDVPSGENTAETMLKNDDKRTKIDDVRDSAPDYVPSDQKSANDVLF